MSNNQHAIRHIISLLSLIFFLLYGLSSCNDSSKNKDTISSVAPSHENRLDSTGWNVLFNAGTNEAARNQAVQKIMDSVKQYYLVNYPAIHPHFKVFFCPCDTLLYNLNIKFLDGSGNSVSSPPPPPPGPAGSGDYVNVMFIDLNNPIEDFERDDSTHASVPTVSLMPTYTKGRAILGIIDTGIDTTKFPSGFSDFLWKDPRNGKTLYNFLPGQNIHKMDDDHKYRHGTIVTAFALKSIQISGQYPQIMVLKALDHQKRGSSFSVSCAMSYAIQHQVTLINESLGYYGDPDPVLWHYLQLTHQQTPSPISIFVAAGNTTGAHSNPLCSLGFNNNLLRSGNQFFPACFSGVFDNITSVTSLNNTTPNFPRPCYYQNYSWLYVSLGVLNRASFQCCSFRLNTSGGVYEGSSYATPIASGFMIDCLQKANLDPVQANVLWQRDFIRHSSGNFTKNGAYVVSPD